VYEKYGVLSTSILAELLKAPRRDLIMHGCNVADEPEKRVRIDWPKGTVLDSGKDEYTLPDGWTVRIKR